jgi:uncharacterized membrane protein YqjE
MSEPPEPGLFGSLKRLLDTAVATLQNRVELFATEFREETYRLIEAIILTAALTALAITTLTLVTLTIVILFWDSARVATLIALSVIYLLASILACRTLLLRMKSNKPFSATLDELKKDRECLRTKK